MLTHRASGVVNFAHAAMGVYVAFAFFEFRSTGDVVFPVLGLPARVHLVPRPTLATSLIVAFVLASVLGLLVYALIFRPLRHAPPLARVVASLGLFLYLQQMVQLRFPVGGAAVQSRRAVLSEVPVHVLGTTVTTNRLLLAGLVAVVTVFLVVLTRFTRFGLATSAAAANEKGALLIGLSSDKLGAVNWMLASVLAGFAVILIEPISGLDASTTSLLVVPALAAALLGGLSSFPLTAAGGLAIGMVQAWVLGYAVQPSTTWIPTWLPTTGLQQAIPVIAIVAVLVFRGDALPDRTAIIGRRLPPAPTPRHVARWAVVLSTVVIIALETTGAATRQALIVTMLFALLSLSVVVVTGYVGQISLAPLAFAGVAGFAVIHLVENHVPFPLALILAALLATLLGLIIGVPATRVRGMSLAVATLAIAVAIEALVLASEPFSGGAMGMSAPRPSLFGMDLGVSALGDANFRPAFGITVLVVLVLACLAVAGIRRSRMGLRWLAVRANERAAAAAGIDVTGAKLGAFAVSSFLAGLAGALMAFSTTTLSPSSFMVIGSLVVVSLTYLAGVSSISGALVAGSLAQAGIVTTLASGSSGGSADEYMFAISGLALIVAAIAAPEGITGLWRGQYANVSQRVTARRVQEPRETSSPDATRSVSP